MTLLELKALFPKTRENSAQTGFIPMDYFVANETAIRQVVCAERLRVFYRGKRRNDYATDTPRANAYAAVLYSR